MATDKKLAAKHEKEGKEAGFDPDYVYELCVGVHTELLDKASLSRTIGGIRSPMERTIKAYMAHWKCTRERAEQRYRDHAQIYSPTVRATLKILEQRGELPKAARAKEKVK